MPPYLAGRVEERWEFEKLLDQSPILPKGFSPSHVSQMLVALGDAGLIYKNRHGKYAFAVSGR